MYKSQMEVTEEKRSKVMNQKRLGEPGYSVNDVVNALLDVKDQSRLKTGLAKVMIKLKTEDNMRHDIPQKMLIGLLQPCEALADVLLEWKSRAPEEATIEKLINVLSEADLNDFANALGNRFGCTT